jgi:hypothetical protein
MTRWLAATAIVVILTAFTSFSAHAQANEESSGDSQCFPWQELRNGRCVAKPSAPPPAAPLPAPVRAPEATADQPSADPCNPRSLSGRCICPDGTHRDAAGTSCIADAPAAVAPPAAAIAPPPTLCNGGTRRDGACVCPAGFDLMSTDSNPANGGTCVKVHADNCLGGELTVSGTCLCNGRVLMSGETYALEFLNGKCVPKRCSEQTVLTGGRCLAISTSPAAPAPDAPLPAGPKQADAGDQRRQRCGHGMVRTHAGCVPARRRTPDGMGALPSELQRYERNY